jgi:hypothetical protein
MERLRILGEIPLRRPGVYDPEGNPDTSFLAKIPADTPFTFQTLDRSGLVLNMAQTWHQLRPGELRADCGGCHSHSQAPLAFANTAAGQPGFEPVDLTATTPLLSADAQGNPTLRVEPAIAVDVEFLRDIRPLLQRSCVSCHTQNAASPPGNLVLDDLGDHGGVPGDYFRLAADDGAQFGWAPVIANGSWRQTNASRYVRRFQSRRSLLVWKLFGERLDGWTNADHPTESVPGNAATLPPGAAPNAADLDYTGTIMPPVDSGVPPLSEDEKRMVARWIDLGAPIDLSADYQNPGYGWHLDDLRPALAVSAPRAGRNEQVDRIRVGFADANSGIEPGSLSVRADIAIGAAPAGAELAGHFVATADGVYEWLLPAPLPALAAAELAVEIRDIQGNRTRDVRRFSVPEPAAAAWAAVAALLGLARRSTRK